MLIKKFRTVRDISIPETNETVCDLNHAQCENERLIWKNEDLSKETFDSTQII